MRHASLFSILLLISLFTGFTSSHAASDTAKEKRWAAQIKDSLFEGEIVWLTAKGQAKKNQNEKFLGIYTRETAEVAQGGAILLHGMGAHPNWPAIIFPLRLQLPEHGWSTLSIQMPILGNDAALTDYAPLFDEVAGRIDAAIALLKSKGINNIILIGHSLGAIMGAYYLSANDKTAIRAFVGIGMSRNKTDKRMDTPRLLEKISLPVLDIYGEQDMFSVLNSAKQRVNAAEEAGNKFYFPLRIPGADHFFRDREEVLVKRIWGWLNRYAAGKELPVK